MSVALPPGANGAKPQPKAGWTLQIEREPLATATATAIESDSGSLVRERVKAVTWRGHLQDDAFDDFGLMVQLPNTPGPLYFPTVLRRHLKGPLFGRR